MPSQSKRKIIAKTYWIIRQNIIQLQALPVVYDVDFCLPYFQNWFAESIARLIIGTKLWMSNAPITSTSAKIGSCYGGFLSWLW